MPSSRKRLTSIAGEPISSLFPDEKTKLRLCSVVDKARDALQAVENDCIALLWGEKGWTYEDPEAANLLAIGLERKNVPNNLLNALLYLSESYAGSLTCVSLEQFLWDITVEGSLVNHILGCPNVLIEDLLPPRRWLVAQKFMPFAFDLNFGWNPISILEEEDLDQKPKAETFFTKEEGTSILLDERETTSTAERLGIVEEDVGDGYQTMATAAALIVKDMGRCEPAKVLVPKSVYISEKKTFHFAYGKADDPRYLRRFCYTERP